MFVLVTYCSPRLEKVVFPQRECQGAKAALLDWVTTGLPHVPAHSRSYYWFQKDQI